MSEHVKLNLCLQGLAKKSGYIKIDKLGFGEGDIEELCKFVILECAAIAENSKLEQHTSLNTEKVTKSVASEIKRHFGLE